MTRAPQRIITPQSLILDGLVIATGVIVSSAVIAMIDTTTATVASKHKTNPIAKLIAAGVLVVGTAIAAKTILQPKNTISDD